MTAGHEPDIFAETYERGNLYSLQDFLRAVAKRLWLIALVSFVFIGTSVGFSLLQTPEYEASIRILIGQERSITETPTDVMGLQQLTQTMTEAVNSRPVAEAVIRQLDLKVSAKDFLEENMSVEQIPNTQFIQVRYRDSNPERAQRVADAIGEVFSERVSEVSANVISATIWESAAIPDDPVYPNPVRNGLLALALGIMFGVGLAFLLEYLDDSWRSAEEVEQITKVPTLGVIPEIVVPKTQKRKI